MQALTQAKARSHAAKLLRWVRKQPAHPCTPAQQLARTQALIAASAGQRPAQYVAQATAYVLAKHYA